RTSRLGAGGGGFSISQVFDNSLHLEQGPGQRITSRGPSRVATQEEVSADTCALAAAKLKVPWRPRRAMARFGMEFPAIRRRRQERRQRGRRWVAPHGRVKT